MEIKNKAILLQAPYLDLYDVSMEELSRKCMEIHDKYKGTEGFIKVTVDVTQGYQDEGIELEFFLHRKETPQEALEREGKANALNLRSKLRAKNHVEISGLLEQIAKLEGQ